MEKFTAKIDFPIVHFMLPLLMLTLEVLSLSIHYLISILTTCWWNLNKIVWIEPYEICAFSQKVVNNFDKVLTTFWQMFLWLKRLFEAKILFKRLLFRCSKNCGTPDMYIKSCTKYGRPDQFQLKLTIALSVAKLLRCTVTILWLPLPWGRCRNLATS